MSETLRIEDCFREQILNIHLVIAFPKKKKKEKKIKGFWVTNVSLLIVNN